MDGQPGIEIQVGLSLGQKVIGKVLKAMHLDVIGRAVAGMSTAVMDIDGERTVGPLYEPHFIACAPGTHDVEVFMQGKGPASDKLSAFAYGASLSAIVEPNEVTILVYTPKDGMGATLTLVGRRPA